LQATDTSRFVCNHIVDIAFYIFPKYGSWKGFKQQKWLSRSLKVIGISVIRYATLVVIYRTNIAMLYRFRNTVSYFPTFK